MKRTSSFWITALACGLALGTSTAAVAQRPAHMPRTQRAASHSSTAPSRDNDRFRGVAAKLNTTPDALESAYQTALQANPELKRGQFVAERQADRDARAAQKKAT